MDRATSPAVPAGLRAVAAALALAAAITACKGGEGKPPAAAQGEQAAADAVPVEVAEATRYHHEHDAQA